MMMIKEPHQRRFLHLQDSLLLWFKALVWGFRESGCQGCLSGDKVGQERMPDCANGQATTLKNKAHHQDSGITLRPNTCNILILF